ncbi:MAG: vitamin K epoxide reductase family protein [Terriglobia bacterium]
MKISPWICWALIILSFAGLIDSSIVGLHASTGFLIPCGFAGGCDQVLSSSYARVFGMSVAWFGFAFYLTMAGAGLFAFFGTPEVLKISFSAACLAFLVSLYLLYLQAFVIRAFCDYCLLSASLVCLIFGLHLWANPWSSPSHSSPER